MKRFIPLMLSVCVFSMSAVQAESEVSETDAMETGVIEKKENKKKLSIKDAVKKNMKNIKALEEQVNHLTELLGNTQQKLAAFMVEAIHRGAFSKTGAPSVEEEQAPEGEGEQDATEEDEGGEDNTLQDAAQKVSRAAMGGAGLSPMESAQIGVDVTKKAVDTVLDAVPNVPGAKIAKGGVKAVQNVADGLLGALGLGHKHKKDKKDKKGKKKDKKHHSPVEDIAEETSHLFGL